MGGMTWPKSYSWWETKQVWVSFCYKHPFQNPGFLSIFLKLSLSLYFQRQQLKNLQIYYICSNVKVFKFCKVKI